MRIIFHIAFDYFFAQCEEIRNQTLKTKPVCVCIFSDRGGDSAAIATANYIARKYGVKSGMPIKFAKARLKDIPESVFLPADFPYYSEISQKAMEIMKNHADIFEYVGKDEAYLDVTKKTEGKFSNATHLAQQLKNQIRTELKMTCTVGISGNKLVSKIASGFKKPDGLTVVEPENAETFLGQLKVGDIPGIGKVTEEKFTEMNLKTIADLRRLDIFTLNKMFGRKISSYMYNASRGIDDEPVAEHPPQLPNLRQDNHPLIHVPHPRPGRRPRPRATPRNCQAASPLLPATRQRPHLPHPPGGLTHGPLRPERHDRRQCLDRGRRKRASGGDRGVPGP